MALAENSSGQTAAEVAMRPWAAVMPWKMQVIAFSQPGGGMEVLREYEQCTCWQFQAAGMVAPLFSAANGPVNTFRFG